MIVDDDRTTVRLLQTLLEMDGFDVVVMGYGQQALEQARQTPPDLFLVDYHLADMDGVELIRKLRAEPALVRTPIVVASGRDVQDEVLKAGANQFLVKPFEPNNLAQTFYNLLK
jgi:DNA-binding response OmpR family regulator